MYFYNRDDTPSIPHSNSSLLDSPPPSPLVSCTPNAASIMVLHHQVTSLHAHNRKVQKCATYFKAHSDRFRKKLYSTTRQAQHSKTQQQVAESELKTIQDEIKAAKKLVIDNLTMHEHILADMAVKDAVHATKLQQVKGKLKRVQQDLRKLRRCGVTLQAQIEKLVGSSRKHSLLRKGVYTGVAHLLMWQLACLGVPAEKISTIMHLCAHSYGVTLIGNPSAWAVGHAICEGHYAAQIQLGQEITDADGK